MDTGLFLIILVQFHFLLVDGHGMESVDTNAVLRTVLKKLEELQTTVHIQSDRISQLEKHNQKLENTIAADLNKQNERISILEKQYLCLEESGVNQSMDILTQKKLNTNNMKKISSLLRNQNIQEKRYRVLKNRFQGKTSYFPQVFTEHKESLIRKERLLATATTAASFANIVAFYAYLSKNVPSPSGHHILTFNTVITNAGNAYHPHSGTFIAPRSGLYVFTWTIRMYGVAYHSTELLVNNSIIGSTYLNSGNVMDGSVTGTVVVHVDQGDDVFIRTGATLNGGNIISTREGISSFAGWALA